MDAAKGMWLFYERELFGDEDLKQVISRMILHLEAGFMFLHRAMAASEENESDSEEIVDDSDDKEDIE